MKTTSQPPCSGPGFSVFGHHQKVLPHLYEKPSPQTPCAVQQLLGYTLKPPPHPLPPCPEQNPREQLVGLLPEKWSWTVSLQYLNASWKSRESEPESDQALSLTRTRTTPKAFRGWRLREAHSKQGKGLPRFLMLRGREQSHD